VLALDEPTVDELQPYLTDADPGVRRTAVDVLTEHLCDGYAPALVSALSDPHVEVRRVAADGIRELVEVLPDPVAVQPLLTSGDPVVRGAVVYVLSSRRAGIAEHYRRALADADHRVRIEAVRALVSVDDADGVAAARADANREVRIAVANGLGTLGTGAPAVRALIDDPDPLVRAAALAAMGAIGWDVGRSAVADGRRAAAIAGAVRSAPRRAQGGGAEPDAVGLVGGGGARSAHGCARRRRRRRAGLRQAGAGGEELS